MDNQFKIDGEILCIEDTRPAKEGSTMMLRDFIIKKPNVGEANDLKFVCKGNNTTLLDKFEIGDKVVITFCLTGTFGGAKYKEGNVKTAKNPFGLSTFSPNLTCFEIEFVQGFVRQANPNPVQGNQQYGGNSNVSFTSSQNSNANPNADARVGTINPATGKIYTPEEIKDDLPF